MHCNGGESSPQASKRVMVTYFNRKTNNSVTVYIFFILAFHFQYNLKSASIFFSLDFQKQSCTFIVRLKQLFSTFTLKKKFVIQIEFLNYFYKVYTIHRFSIKTLYFHM